MAVTPLIPALWSARITHFLSTYSAFMPNATRAWEGEAVYGNTIKVPTIDRSVTIRDYSRTADLAAPEDIDATTQDLAINQEKYFSFALEDLDARQSRIGGSVLIDTKSSGAALAMTDLIDSFVLDQLLAVPTATLTNTANAAFDLDFTSTLKQNLMIAGQAVNNMVLVLTPETLRHIDEGVLDTTYGDVVTASAIRSGFMRDPSANQNAFVGRINGFRTYVSRNQKMKLTAADAAVAGDSRGARSLAWCYDPRDLALVVQVNRVESYRLEKRFATGVKGLTNWGSKVLNGGRMFRFNFTD